MLFWDDLIIPVAKLAAVPPFAMSYAMGGRSKIWRWIASIYLLLYPFEVAAQLERGTNRILIFFCVMIVAISGIVGFREGRARRAKCQSGDS